MPTEAWLQATRYTAAVMSDVPRRNGWTIAKVIGDKTPDLTQRLLNRACWDEAAAMSAVRRFAVAGLDEAARRSGRRLGIAVGALDETGQEKHGSATAGVQRQHMGCAGGVENGINTVHLSYVRDGTGHALIGARQWIPAGQITDPVRSLLTALPLDLQFATKGQLAKAIVADALADGVRVDCCPSFGVSARASLAVSGDGAARPRRRMLAGPWGSGCRRDAHSVVTSVTAARAEDSSTMALLAVNAASRAAMAMLLTARG